MKPRIRVGRMGTWWLAWCDVHGVVATMFGWDDAYGYACHHARTHRRTDIASFLALRDDHPPSDRRWEPPLPHDLEPPC